jgi:polysaccharide biosynthesis/export protein
MKRHPALFLLLILACAALGASRAEAQARPVPRDTISRAAAAVTNQEIVERLRRSGMSRATARTRLQQMGHDPALADAYYDRLSRADSMPGMPNPEFAQALADIGLLSMNASGDSVGELEGRRIGGRPQDATPSGDQIFGRDLFRRESNEFVPSVAGPIDPSYQLGPGDEITLIITGDVESSYRLLVGRDGSLVIPEVGQLQVAGITLGQLEERLYQALGRVYSGVQRGSGATTHFQVSLGRLRSIQVYITGDAEWPGAYQLNAASTVFHALYQAGGPTPIGSFRLIQVRRGGNVIRTVDLYDYLIRGDSRNDIRLQQNDQIFIPPAPRQVKIRGAVRRPAVYELKPEDDLRDLLEFAAGVSPGAILRNVQIDRILPPEQRTPGVDRVLVDVPLESLMRTNGPPITLQDGDLVQVSAVSDVLRNRVTVAGSVRRPGLYEWRPGLTLGALLERAEGVEESALLGRVHILRLNLEDGTRSLQRLSLQDGASAVVALADRDSIIIYDRIALTTIDSVTIDGLVRNPGRYELPSGAGLKDIILAAGGLQPGAYLSSVEVARRRSSNLRGDSLATVFAVPLLPADALRDSVGRDPADVLNWTPALAEFQLFRDDHISVRRMPGDEDVQTVHITGEVHFPGTYVLQNRDERITSLLSRAGGLGVDAYPEGIQVWRKRSLMGIDVRRVLTDPASRYNVALEIGDSIHVPRYDPTVLVQGAVGFTRRVLFIPGRSIQYYIDQAGGYSEDADKKRISIAFPNGERETRRSVLFVSGEPEVRPGSSIFVPARPASDREGVDWDRALTRVLTVMSGIATLILTYNQIK